MEGYPPPPASSADERRIAQRRRIIKTGVIAYSGKHMTLPCVVRDLSDTGARLQVQDVRQIPDLFELLIELDGFQAECSVAWRENTQVGVSFTSSPDSFAPKRAQVVSQSEESGKPLIRTDRIKRLEQPDANEPVQETHGMHDAAPPEPQDARPPAAEQPAATQPAAEQPAATRRAAESSIPILIAEDDPDDRLLISQAFDESDFAHPIDFVSDGEELLRYVSAEGDFTGRPKPGLILLDLNMPKIDGRQALMHLKSKPGTRSIPVVVFTTSNCEDDIERTYDLGVQSYITKPSTFEGLLEVVQTLNVYWSRMATVPSSVRA